MENNEGGLEAARALTPAASSSHSSRVQTPRRLPAITEKGLFVSMADLGCREPSPAQLLPQPRAEQRPAVALPCCQRGLPANPASPMLQGESKTPGQGRS